ncbi:MAG: FAD-binding oxidoreductase [Pseudomonadota bacterium]|nr:FAD-binding oxidoreductase [Pseudomonadota bacterium]
MPRCACKAELVGGSVDYGEYDEKVLSDEERMQGKVLLCQARPLEDVVIDVPEVASAQSIQIKTLPCRVARKERLADDVVRLYLTLPKNQQLEFLPGQYIDILLPDGQRRSFSLANTPAEAEAEGLELHIRLVAGGAFTPKVFDTLHERDLLRFEGPFGTYFLRRDAERPIILVAGGTGFAPIKGILRQALNEDLKQPLHLFWGARTAVDIYLDALAREWEKTCETVHYTPVLSEAEGETWKGARGFVHEEVLRQHPDLKPFDVYASGPPPMIEAARSTFAEHGLDAERFFFDSFDYGAEGRV